MEVYLAGTPANLTIPLQDRHGNELDVSAVEFRLVNELGEELIARASLLSFAVGDTEVTVEVPASLNALAPGVVRGGRTVELFLTVGDNTVSMLHVYAVEPAEPLLKGVNSFQGFAQAKLVALDMPALTGWSAADDREKIAALIEARTRVGMLSFSILTSDLEEGAVATSYLKGALRTVDLLELTENEFGRLPAEFVKALCFAQVAEADSLLGGDPADQRRRDGLVLESIGEVKQMFRSGKALELPVSKRALRYLSRYVTFSKRIGRG